MKSNQYLTAQEAAAELGISVATLYAYVSRGLIRSETLDVGKRTKRYLAEDVNKLKERKEQRRNPAKAVEGALHWGAPVLESALTLITEDHLFYRGYDALHLCQHYSIEQVAILLWTGDLLTGEPEIFRNKFGLPPAVEHSPLPITSLERFQTILPIAAQHDPAAYDLRPEAVIHTGAHLLRLFAAVASGAASAEAGVAETLQQNWAPNNPQAKQFIQAALILCADHELNVSSFTARCVASARATPYQVVIAGLAALQGAWHGRETERFEAFLHEVERPEKAQDVIVNRLRRGESVPGCGHPLYPNGDPRGKMLFEMVEGAYPDIEVVRLVTAIKEAANEIMGEHLTLDSGLVMLAHALKLPKDGALTLFAIGRTVGWIGQALEAYTDPQMIRPRAKYVGEMPKNF